MTTTSNEIRDAFLARLDAAGDKAGPEWQDLRSEIAALGDAAFAPPSQGGTLAASLYVASGGYDSARRVPAIWEVYAPWAEARKVARDREERARMLAATVEIIDFRGAKLAKPRRVPRDEATMPWRPGCLIVTETARVEGRDFDSDFGPKFSIRSAPVGTEREEGTIVAKRIAALDGKKRVQYLVKPRSGKAERLYVARKRIAEIESILGVEADYLSGERRAALIAERDQLASQAGGK